MTQTIATAIALAHEIRRQRIAEIQADIRAKVNAGRGRLRLPAPTADNETSWKLCINLMGVNVKR